MTEDNTLSMDEEIDQMEDEERELTKEEYDQMKDDFRKLGFTIIEF